MEFTRAASRSPLMIGGEIMAQGSRKPAIDIDQIADKTLAEVSAADFLQALSTDAVLAGPVLKFWPEKKKYELYLEPEGNRGIRIKDLLKGAREKKKVELEKPPGTEFEHKMAHEDVVDPRVVLRDPTFIRELAREVAAHLKG
jgi:hypothetical protein